MEEAGLSTNIRDSSDRALVPLIQALRRYAHALVGNHADADDLVQETLKRALAYVDGKKPIDNLRAYLFAVLHNVRVDALKKQRRAGIAVPIDEGTMVSPGAPQSERLACHQVVDAMSRLSEEHREVLILVGVEGMTYAETAEVLGVAIGTVMSRLSRARAALRELLGVENEILVAGAPS